MFLKRILFILLCTTALQAEEFTIVLDPGHGGAVTHRPDERWDPVTGQFLSPYLPGASWKGFTEHELMLALSMSVHRTLALTESEAGWKEFEKLLSRFSGQKKFPRIRFRVLMTRRDGYNHRKVPATSEQVNEPYRLYDFPGPDGAMQHGRLSFINEQNPDLVLALHLNSAGEGNTGGMATVLSPGYRTFDLIRQIHLGQRPASLFKRLPWVPYWISTEPGWSKFESARADTWVYYHGFWTNKKGTAPWKEKARGFRHNLLTWAYRDPPGWIQLARKAGPGPYSMDYRTYQPEGRFWDRERSKEEEWRREAAVPGTGIHFGGDNHFAGEELLRFVQYGVRIQEHGKRRTGKIGPILPPFVSAYALPTYTNAIVAFLEIGHINVRRDRRLVTEQREEVAQALAAGIYSLFAGLELKPGFGPYRPTGRPLDFAKYGAYFKEGSGSAPVVEKQVPPRLQAEKTEAGKKEGEKKDEKKEPAKAQ